ncbi:Fic family protein [Bifidobacterium panos]
MRRVYIRPLLEEKRLFLTMPDKPRSKQQRYVSGSRVDF